MKLQDLMDYRNSIRNEESNWNLTVEFRIRQPRTKKRRIRNKWRNDPRYWVPIDDGRRITL